MVARRESRVDRQVNQALQQYRREMERSAKKCLEKLRNIKDDEAWEDGNGMMFYSAMQMAGMFWCSYEGIEYSDDVIDNILDECWFLWKGFRPDMSPEQARQFWEKLSAEMDEKDLPFLIPWEQRSAYDNE